jgi:hypothetical protein
MVITLSPELEAALKQAASRRGVAPEALALDALRERFLGAASPLQPRDEWERRLLGMARDCGISLSLDAIPPPLRLEAADIVPVGSRAREKGHAPPGGLPVSFLVSRWRRTMEHEFVAWPFPVWKPEAEWDEFDRDLFDFLRTAYAEGYRPRLEKHCTMVEAGEPTGRSVWLVPRGPRNGWEPFLGEGEQAVRLGPSFGFEETRCVCVRPPFRAAAHLALEWLRGRALAELLSDFEFGGGRPEGIVLRPGTVRPSVVVRGHRG